MKGKRGATTTFVGECLNPCYNGIKMKGDQHLRAHPGAEVLILVLMEYKWNN